MAVSKRLRFEVLRRDNHQCRYCGGIAPDVALTVDHVVPVALGGSDEPSNLVAACKDCNAGKSSASADATMVDDVAQDAARWAAAMRQAADENKLHDNTATYEDVVNAWTSFRRDQIPGDYRETIDQFLAAGLPAADIVQMAHVADAKPNIYKRWAYFCGCCWTRIRQLQSRAQEIVSGVDNSNSHHAQNWLATSWSKEDINLMLDATVQLVQTAEPQFSRADLGRKCEHGHGCEDVLCLITSASALVMAISGRHERGEAVLDELDALELSDG